MNIIKTNIKNLTTSNLKIENLVIGDFDGLHLAHANLIHSYANDLGSYNITVMFFSTLSKHYFNSNKKYLSNNEIKIELFEYFGIKNIIILDFDNNLVNTSALDFVNILKNIGVKNIACGSNFNFGYQASGNLSLLKKHFKTYSIDVNEYEISSSKIINNLATLNIEDVNNMLLRPFFLRSTVVKGNMLGRTIGFKTANLLIDNNQAYPKDGVYAIKVEVLNNKYNGICNIGFNPTVSNDKSLKVEVHILDFDQDIYNEEIKVTFYSYLREECQFSNLEELKNQLIKDVKNAKASLDYYDSINYYNYELNDNKIAQRPEEKRDNSKLLVLNRYKSTFVDKHFFDITNYFKKGDVLVLNDSKVIPARLYGKKENTSVDLEILLLNQVSIKPYIYESIIRGARKVKIDSIITIARGFKLQVLEKSDSGIIKLELLFDDNKISLFELLKKYGTMPLPPYIKEKLVDQNKYQTVYANIEGSSAAPTAGLHFTNELLEKISSLGVKIVYITLHVGLGTFLPVRVDNFYNHNIHHEYCTINESSADIINKAIINGNRIIACGTTVVRTLESFYKNNKINSGTISTSIYIYPGFKFNVVNSLITNFHLPKSTLLLLVSALSKRSIIFDAYKHAIENDYKFFSFGDAMLIY